MPIPTPDWIFAADLLAAWMLTYLLHSSLLLGLAWLVTRLLPVTALPLQETLWKTALLGGLATATLQIGLGIEPLAGSWSLRQPAAAVERPAPEPPLAVRPEVSPAATVRAVAPWSERALPAIEAPSPIASAPVPAAPPSPPARFESRWLGALWLLVAPALLAALAVSELRFRRRLRGRRTVERGPLAALLAELLARAGLSRPVRLTSTPRISVPLARGVLRPEICVPSRVERELAPERQELVLAHELAHLRRRDPLWLLVTRLVERLFFFQPLNLLARRQLQEISEYRCDDWAVEATGRPVTLARCLAEVAEWSLARRRAALAPSMAASPSRLRRRVERLLDRGYPQPADALPRWIVPAAAAVLVAWVLVAPAVTGAAWQGDHEPAPEAPPATETPPAPEAPPAPESPEPPELQGSEVDAPPAPKPPAPPIFDRVPGEAPPAPAAPPAPPLLATPGSRAMAPLPPAPATPGTPVLAPPPPPLPGSALLAPGAAWAPEPPEPAVPGAPPLPAIAPRPWATPDSSASPRPELAPAPSAPLPPGFFISPEELARLEALGSHVAALSPEDMARWNAIADEIGEGVERSSQEAERLNELARRLSESVPGSEEWARWQAELNEIGQRIAQQAAEEMRPDPQELERLQETARLMAEQSRLRREDLELLRIELREVMEESRHAREEARRALEEHRLEIHQKLEQEIAQEVSEERRRHLEMQREQLEARHHELALVREQLEEVRRELERAREELRALHQDRRSPPPTPEP